MLAVEFRRIVGMTVSAVTWFAGCRSKPPAPDPVATALGRISLADVQHRQGAAYSLPYRLFVPRTYNASKVYPLVLYLHGWGANGTDNLSQLSTDVAGLVSDKAQGVEPFFVLVPQCPVGDEWVNRHDSPPFRNYDQSLVVESLASQLTFEVLRLLQEKYSIDSKRLYITGYSMGGSGTWDFITRHPGVFAAAVPVTGVNDPNRAPMLIGLPIWAFHGDKDGVSPAANTQAMVKALRQLGGDMKYSELKGIGHDSNRFVYQDVVVYKWLLSQRGP